jgi:glycosyltransferase involved in cell wall biosynthesis
MEKYVIITPARNEGGYIEKTIQSVVSQTVLPLKWIIVSDGSTDQTNEIVLKYLPCHPWMELVKVPEHAGRHFASKVRSFNAGYEKVKDLDYEIIGNLDADISFENDYFEYLLGKFAESSELGVAGTPFVEGSFRYDYRFTNIEHVSGACQLFRRKCFEEVGGYTPIRGGGEDWTAVTIARMKGWKTRTFTEKTCLHHKRMGFGNCSRINTNFMLGERDYFLGNHPIWQCCRTLYQMTRKPYIFGGLVILIGYVLAALRAEERPIPRELVQFIRREQFARLKNFFLG